MSSEDEASESNSESEIEMHTGVLAENPKKPPLSPTYETLRRDSDSKKMTTKMMIHECLKENTSRKGVSNQAIKKYLKDKYSVDTVKINHIIKTVLKKGVEKGTIIHTKGIGAAGSFRLVPLKEQKKKKKKVKTTKEKSEKSEPSEKVKKVKVAKAIKIGIEKPSPKKMKKKPSKPEKIQKKVDNTEKAKPAPEPKKTTSKSKPAKKDVAVSDVSKAIKKVKKTKQLVSPTKKAAMLKRRKSLGSIIAKPPKMKPKKA